MNGTGPLSFNALINDAQFRATLDGMERRIAGLGNTAQNQAQQLDRTFARLGGLAAGYFSFQALTELPAQIFRVRGEFQQLEVAFSTMLRSKTKADALLTDLVQTAATTPFGLKDIASGAKQLLAYGSAAGSIVSEIRTLGTVAAGVSVPINDLIYLYGTLRTQGRAYAVDIRQFAGRGIPIYAELAKVLGVSVDKVNDLVSAGKVGFKEVEQAFKNMTGAGGQFEGLLEAQSKTLLGLKERLSDAFDIALNEIGKKNEDVFAGIINLAADAVTHYQDIIDILKTVAIVYGSYKAAVFAVAAFQKAELFLLQSIAVEQSLAAASGEVLTFQQARQIVVTKTLERAQASLNATMLANPYVLIGTLILGVVAAYFAFNEEAKKIKSSQEILSGTSKEIAGQFRQQRGEVTSLISVLKNQSVAESERLKAYDKLKSIAPDILSNLSFEAAKVADLTKATNDYLNALRQRIQLESVTSKAKEAYDQQAEAAERLKKAQDDLNKNAANTRSSDLGLGQRGISAADYARKALDAAVAYKAKSDKVVEDIEGNIKKIYSGQSNRTEIEGNIAGLERSLRNINKLSPAYKQAEESLLKYRAELKSLNESESTQKPQAARTSEYYDNEIKQLKEKQSQQAANHADYLKFQREIDALEAAKRRITGKLTADEKRAASKAQKEADKTGPYGSIAYYETIARKAQEIIDKTPDSNPDVLKAQNQIKFDAEQRLEQIRKANAIRSFDEELDYKKQQYQTYNSFIEAYGAEFADLQFRQLRQGSASYVDYLTSQIDALKKAFNGGTIDADGLEKLSKLTDARAEATGGKTRIEVFRESLQKAGQDAETLTAYLAKLRQEQQKLDPADNSALGIEKRKELSEQIAATENDRRARLKEFLVSVEGSEQQRLAITARYADLRAAIEKEYQNKKKGAAYFAATAEISKAEQADLDRVKQNQIEASAAFKELNSTMLEQGRDALKKRLSLLKDYLKEAEKTFGKESEQYKAAFKNTTDAQNALDADTLNNYRTFARLGGELAGALSEVNGGLGLSARLIGGLAAGADNLATIFDETASKADKVSAGVSGLINLVNIVVSAAKQRKEAETAYYNSVIGQQQAYNIALNEQIGLQTQLSDNVFVTDYAGQLTDRIKQLSDAQKSYAETLAKLSQGKAKTGQRNAVDFGAIGSGVSSGAAVGAALGTIVPVIGTITGSIVGGIVGGIVGLFGGKKKQDQFGGLLQEYPELIRKSKDGVDELNTELAQTLIAQNLVDDQTRQLLQSTIDWTDQIKKAEEAIKQIIGQLAGQLGNSLRDSLVGAFKDGTDSAKAFGDSVSKVLEDVLSQIIFNQVFGSQFDQLQKELQASSGANGDGSWIDDFGRFFSKADELTKIFNQGLDQAKDTAKQYGLDVFAPSGKGKATNDPNSLSGAIKGVTQETASVLAGQINAIRLSQAETGSLIRQQLVALSNISGNSNYLPYLEEINKNIKALQSDPLRAKGQPG